MARMLPDFTDEQIELIPSAAERLVYRTARQRLDDRHLVLHGVEWIVRTPHGDVRDGEADFVICHPDKGVLVIEVKGGGIEYDPVTDKWYSVDRFKSRNEIDDPFWQAKTGKFSVLAKLKEHSAWLFGSSHILIGHAVLLPDIDDIYTLCMPQRPKGYCRRASGDESARHLDPPSVRLLESNGQAPNAAWGRRYPLRRARLCQTGQRASTPLPPAGRRRTGPYSTD